MRSRHEGFEAWRRGLYTARSLQGKSAHGSQNQEDLQRVWFWATSCRREEGCGQRAEKWNPLEQGAGLWLWAELQTRGLVLGRAEWAGSQGPQLVMRKAPSRKRLGLSSMSCWGPGSGSVA